MIVSNIYLNCEDALSYPGKPQRPSPDLQLGLGPTYRLYRDGPVSGDETFQPYENPDPRWVFLSADDDEAFAAFCAVAGREDIAVDPRFVSRGARRPMERTGGNTGRGLRHAQRPGVGDRLPGGVSDASWPTPCRISHSFTATRRFDAGRDGQAEHPSFGGSYWRHAPVVGFSQTPGQARAFCEKGEHTRAILEELGFDPPTIALLKEEGVVTWPADQTATAMAFP